jgi:hypothetical protein
MKRFICVMLITSAAIIQTAFAQKTKSKSDKTMENQNFSTTLLVAQSPAEAFKAINNVRGWWSEEIEGSTDKLNAEFKYHYEDVHICKMKIVELVPDKKVAWLVMENYFKFTQDKSEWTGNKISFEISKEGKKTKIRLTQEGLVPEYECFEICQGAWTNYIQNSLRSLIETGQGKPNGKDKPQTEDEKTLAGNQGYTASFVVNATPHKVFESINHIAAWWTNDVKGNSQKLNDEFTVQFADIHLSTQKLVELVPDKKVVWLVTDSKLNFVENKHEWTGTKISFEIFDLGSKTQILFTHLGLIPSFQCYEGCSKGWDYWFKGSLFKLLTEGKGTPGL